MGDRLHFATWLGLLGWSLQSLMEFGLYIPALAWPAFTLIGLLLGNRSRLEAGLKSVDKPEVVALPSGRR